jgi:NACHT domain
MCYFLNHANKEQTAKDIMRVYLRQILQQLDDFPDDVLAEYNKYKKSPVKSMPGASVYPRLLVSCVTRFFELYSNPVFILLDAYDELRNSQVEKERADLLNALSLVLKTKKAKLIVTTRPQHREELGRNFPDTTTLEIKANLADIDNFLDQRMSHLPLNPLLKSNVKAAIIEAGSDIW